MNCKVCGLPDSKVDSDKEHYCVSCGVFILDNHKHTFLYCSMKCKESNAKP